MTAEDLTLYNAFDGFLLADTWHTRHPSDEERFYRALSKVVRSSRFNADQLGENLRAKTGVTRDDEDDTLDRAIDRWIQDAWAVRQFLQIEGL